MKLETIENLWAEDARLDSLDLGKEALSVPQLHSKYYKIFIGERLTLKKQESDLKDLTALRYGFYTGTIDDETL